MWVKGEIIQRVDWNDKLFSLKIKAPIAPYIAGQFIKLSQLKEDKRVARAYSIVNAPGDDFIEVLAVAVEDGQLSPQLQSLSIGDTIDVSPKASGFMTLDEIPQGELQGKHLWLLSTGTAVGPFISMLLTSEPWERFEKVVLVYGVRLAVDLAYINIIQQLQLQYPEQFCFVPIVTRESYDGALNCRIPQAIDSGLLQKQLQLDINPQDSQVMICGNPGMIADAQNTLEELGLTKNLRRAPGQITVEKYW
ncbi:ferredoxin--NADP reductase [Shewanella gaetbuli]